MKKLILMLLMCVFTTAATSSLFAQTSGNKKTKTPTQQPIKRYTNNSTSTKNTNKKQRVNKVQPKTTPSKKAQVVPKAKKD